MSGCKGKARRIHRVKPRRRNGPPFASAASARTFHRFSFGRNWLNTVGEVRRRGPNVRPAKQPGDPCLWRLSRRGTAYVAMPRNICSVVTFGTGSLPFACRAVCLPWRKRPNFGWQYSCAACQLDVVSQYVVQGQNELSGKGRLCHRCADLRA